MLTSREYSALKQKHESWGSRLANTAVLNNVPNPPTKKGHYWFATEEQWDKTAEAIEELRKNGTLQRLPRK